MPNFHDDRAQKASAVLKECEIFLSHCHKENIGFEGQAFNLLCEYVGIRLVKAAKSDSTKDLLSLWDSRNKDFFAKLFYVGQHNSPRLITKLDVSNAFRVCPKDPDIE